LTPSHRLAGIHQALSDLSGNPEAQGAFDPSAHNPGKRFARPRIRVNRDDADQRRQGARVIRCLLAAGDREGGQEKGGDCVAQGRLPVDGAANIQGSNEYVNSLHENLWSEASKNEIGHLLGVRLQAVTAPLLQ
jgi:hypothetical protein